MNSDRRLCRGVPAARELPGEAALTYGNVVATIALFVALGGVSFAATQIPRNSVGIKQLKNEADSTAKIKNGAITEEKIADSSITTSKLADGAVTGAKVNSSSLGTVPSAAFATNADHAARADRAAQSSRAELATEPKKPGSHTKLKMPNPSVESQRQPTGTQWCPMRTFQRQATTSNCGRPSAV